MGRSYHIDENLFENIENHISCQGVNFPFAGMEMGLDSNSTVHLQAIWRNIWSETTKSITFSSVLVCFGVWGLGREGQTRSVRLTKVLDIAHWKARGTSRGASRRRSAALRRHLASEHVF